MRRLGYALMLCVGVAGAQQGVNVGEASSFRNMVPAEQMERESNKQYRELLQQANAKGALAPDGHPQLKRLRAIARRLLPHAERFNPQAANWNWEVNLIGSKQVNAFCMPGGKIAFFTGILDTLKLSDDEVAMIMGHEMAHALREHARAQVAKNQLTGLAGSLLGMVAAAAGYGGDLTNLAISAGQGLAGRAFSRGDERDADLVGLELAARGGFNPRAGITLWEKMDKASQGAPPEFLSTHPASDTRIEEIRRHLPQVIPLYERAQANLQ